MLKMVIQELEWATGALPVCSSWSILMCLLFQSRKIASNYLGNKQTNSFFPPFWSIRRRKSIKIPALGRTPPHFCLLNSVVLEQRVEMGTQTDIQNLSSSGSERLLLIPLHKGGLLWWNTLMDEIKTDAKISAKEVLTPWKFLVKALWK